MLGQPMQENIQNRESAHDKMRDSPTRRRCSADRAVLGSSSIPDSSDMRQIHEIIIGHDKKVKTYIPWGQVPAL